MPSPRRMRTLPGPPEPVHHRTISGKDWDNQVVIRFRFRLRPVAEVAPWGHGPDRRLHWFGLTDGWYWIDIDGMELLRYAPQMLQEQGGDGPTASNPYADYYVVRLWEDVLGLLRQVMEPVPDDLADFMSSDPESWAWPDEGQGEAQAEAVEWASEWHGGHVLDVGYLRCAPCIRWWRRIADGHDHMTVSWEHQTGEIEFAGPPTGQATIPTSEFIAAVEELNRELLAAMEQRVTELERTGPPPGVDIDMRQLRAEQRDRATWLQRERDQKPQTDWAKVRMGADILLGPRHT